MSKAPSSKRDRSDPFAPIDPTIVAREKVALFQMLSELNIVQRRLGTPAELGRDCQRARDLGHGIRNKLHLLRLWGSLGMIKPPKPDSSEQLQAV